MSSARVVGFLLLASLCLVQDEASAQSWSRAQVDDAVRVALTLEQERPQEGFERMRAAVAGTGEKDAKARFFLARLAAALYHREVNPTRAEQIWTFLRQHLQGAALLANDGSYPDNAKWARHARERLTALEAERTALGRAVRLDGKVLERGATGPAVADLQRRLGIAPTGIFGPSTEEALIAWQRRNGVEPTGKVGDTTLASLDDAQAGEFDAGSSSSFDAWDRGRRLGAIDVVQLDGKPVATATARAFVRMRDAARRDGVRLTIVSGFRSYAQQERLYRLYRAGRGNLAARPGYSNHQDGQALDLNTSDRGVYSWLSRNAGRFGFRRTVPSEKWHWEYRQ